MKASFFQLSMRTKFMALHLFGASAIVFLAFVFFSGGESILAGPGEDLFTRKCGKCHVIQQARGRLGRGTSGPDLTHFMRKRPLPFLRLYSRDPEAGRKQFPAIYAREIQGKYKKEMKAVEISAAELGKILELMR